MSEIRARTQERIHHLAERLEQLRSQIAAAAQRAGRSPDDVTLIAVTKNVPAELIRAAYALGIRDFGENRVQEARTKRFELRDLPIRWHMVGSIQRNKVRLVVGSFDWVHSLDRLPLGETLQRRAAGLGRIQPCLVQVQLTGESTKAGVRPEALIPFLRTASTWGNIEIRGLMTIAPRVEDPERVRPVFRRLRELADHVAKERIDRVRMDHISMGMSEDFPIAVEEGATMIRVGRYLFGPREP